MDEINLFFMRVKVRMHVALDFRMKEKVLLDVLHRRF